MSGILQMVFAATSGSGPINTVAPVVTGTAQVRQTLSCTQGTWVSPTPISSYAYQWQHGTTNIPGATSSSYTISYLYSGETIRCVVTATSESGSTGSPSNSTAAVAITTPLAPTIGTATSPTNTSGLVQFVPNPDNGGSVVTSFTATSTPGSITGSAAGTPITVNGLTTGTYYAFTVRATNSAGNSPESGFSNDILPGASAPTNTVSPSISGTAQVREYLSSSSGSWTGIPTPTISYQWQSNGGADIPGETGSSISIPSAYVGSNIRCKVTATNVGGSAVAYTAYSSAVIANTPSEPYGVYAEILNPTTDPRRITVSWYTPVNNGGAAVSYYKIYWSVNGAAYSFYNNTFNLSTNFLGVDGSSYSFKITAINSVGEGPQSSASNTVTPVVPSVSVIMFIQAGGGAGGSNGGGGGGGGGQVVNTSLALKKGTTYPITVGAGGASVAGGTGGDGGASYMLGTTTPVANGGGGGGKVSVIGNSGGSGGGSGGSAGLSPVAAGTPGQGRDGGGTGYNTGGGGGGVNNDGGSPISASYGGGGAPGAAFSSTPFNLPRCGSGGGGGGGTTGGNAWSGAGGGGAAGTAGSAASPFYGGGGGGGGRTTARGGNGGSGIIVMAVLTSDYSGSVTGATVTTNAGYTIMEFYTTGTYTA